MRFAGTCIATPPYAIWSDRPMTAPGTRERIEATTWLSRVCTYRLYAPTRDSEAASSRPVTLGLVGRNPATPPTGGNAAVVELHSTGVNRVPDSLTDLIGASQNRVDNAFEPWIGLPITSADEPWLGLP
jgi:hypothetical protein